MTRLSLLISALWFALAAIVHAQDVPDYDEWSGLADRAELALEAGRASDYIFEELRASIVDWRDIFAQAQNDNQDRLETISAQVAALGSAPESDIPEDDRIAQRRSMLDLQLSRLSVPEILASEAHARANGLIKEIDALFRGRQIDALSARVPTPLNPTNWSTGVGLISDAIGQLKSEYTTLIATDVWKQSASVALPAAGALAILGAILVWRGRRWTLWLQQRATAATRRGRGVVRFVISLVQIMAPTIGVILLVGGILTAGIVDFRGEAFLVSVIQGSISIFLARWIAGHFCGEGEGVLGPLNLTQPVRRRGRFLITVLGWVLALRVVGEGMFQLTSAQTDNRTVLTFLLHLAASIFLFQLGRLLGERRDADEECEERGFQNRLARILGWVARAVAIVVPLLSAVGYISGASLILYATIQSLGVFAIIALLMLLVFDVYALATGVPEESSNRALTPVLISFGMALLGIPVLALVWGARLSDLTEVWTWFREGFALGETRISPTDFITFAIIFAIGYLITRLVQGALSTTILPRTRLDVGGRNAIVSGLGYVGITVSALVAITMAGIDLSNIALVAGALSVGIGFGLQTMVSNFVAGIILLIERPISQGDWIEVGGQMGYVRDISVRSTRIETFDRTDVIVPNSDLIAGQVTNWTHGNSVGRVIVPVGVAYGTDTARVSQILQEIAEANPMVLLNPAPSVVFQGFGADSLDFEIRAILRDVNWVLSVKSEMNHAIAQKFTEEGIEIPFAQRDIWLRNPEALAGKMPTNSPQPGPASPPPGQPAPPQRDYESDGEGDEL